MRAKDLDHRIQQEQRMDFRNSYRGKDEAEWCKYYVSPTFFSSDLVIPMESPFQCPLPNDQGCVVKQAGYTNPVTRMQRKKQVIPPNFDQVPPATVYPCCAYAIHPSYQSRKEGTLLYDKQRLTDELIPDPNKCTKAADIMKGANKAYLDQTSVSKKAMFPKGRAECQAPPLPDEVRSTAPLNEATRRALAETTNRQYNMTTYMHDYSKHWLNADDPVELEKAKKFHRERIENGRSMHYKPEEKLHENALRGRMPSWPVSNNHTINRETGKIVNKSDVSSYEDKTDYRIQKLTPAETSTKTVRFKDAGDPSKVPFSARPDIVFMKGFDLCRSAPYMLGVGNTRKELATTDYYEKARKAAVTKNTREPITAWAAEPTTPGGYRMHNRTMSDNDTLRFDHQRFQQHPTDLPEKFVLFQNNLSQNWNNKLSQSNAFDDVPLAHETGEPTTSKRGDDLTIQNIEEESHPDGKRTSSNFLKKNLTHSSQQQELPQDMSTLRKEFPEGFMFGARAIDFDYIKASEKVADPSSWPLDFKRNEEKLSEILKAAAPFDKKQKEILEIIKARRAVAAAKIENYAKEKEKYLVTSNQKSQYYTPRIKLPPTHLWEAIDYENIGPFQRLAMPYKTIASKRYHVTHPEPVPDLREFGTKSRKEIFLGYHSSAFR